MTDFPTTPSADLRSLHSHWIKPVGVINHEAKAAAAWRDLHETAQLHGPDSAEFAEAAAVIYRLAESFAQSAAARALEAAKVENVNPDVFRRFLIGEGCDYVRNANRSAHVVEHAVGIRRGETEHNAVQEVADQILICLESGWDLELALQAPPPEPAM